MKPLKQVGQSYLALIDGERQLQQGLFEEAAATYRRAMGVSRTIPQDEAFDYDGFDAIAHTGLSCALVNMERYPETLESVEIALRYFNRRGELNQDEGKLWIDAVYNRAVALEGVGRLDEALKAFRIVSEMIPERKGELKNREALLQVVAQSIKRVETALPGKKPADYKAWWEFWA
jgi:tetratricopeptide (TPR) repeat protein